MTPDPASSSVRVSAAAIRYQSDDITTTTIDRGYCRLGVRRFLSFPGVTNRHELEAELLHDDDGVRLRGACSLSLTDYRTPPVAALGGAIPLRDRLRLAFDIVARRESNG